MNSVDFENILGFRNSQSLILSSLFYPMEQARIQIRLSPHPAYNVQRIVGQIKHTHSMAGVQGCYAGFIPWFASAFTYRFVFHGARQAFITDTLKDIDLDDLSEYRRFRRFAQCLGQGIACRIIAVTVSHPFYVVTVRMVAELFANEIKYTNLISSLWTLVREEGLNGLFSGLFPRLLADVTLYSSVATVTYLVHRSFVLNTAARELADLMVASIAGFYCCPLSVVSSRMAINNSGLVAGSPPHMPHFITSYDCWNHLFSK